MDDTVPYFPPYLGVDFGETEDEKIKEFIQSSRSKETVRKSQFWLTKLQEHAKKIGISGDLTGLNKTTWNSLLCSFLINAKKEDGENYETNTIYTLFSLIGRFMKDNKNYLALLSNRVCFFMF